MTCLGDPAASPPHFVLVPLVAQGHMIPMVDLARLLAERGIRVSLITTPVNAARYKAVITHLEQLNLPVEFVELEFPCAKVGLPEGLENADLLTNMEHYKPLFDAIFMLDEPLEAYLRSLPRRADCLIADSCNPWTAGVARRLGIPRLVFHGPSCFFLLATYRLAQHKVYDSVTGDFDPFEVPDFPVHVAANRATALGFFQWPGWEKLREDAFEAEATADGLLINTFDDLENRFVECYEKTLAKKIWTVGPVCLSNKHVDITAARGNRAAIDHERITAWLDSNQPESVFYVSFGSIARSASAQLIEIGCGLEASNRPFIWVLKEAEISPEVRKWFDEGFEERVKDRVLVVRGWAPQMMILAHPAVGGFMTHCGWNSTLEAISLGVPMVTWPHFADQFLTEKLVVEILGVGVPVGVKVPSTHALLMGEEFAVQVRREDVQKAVAKLMDEGMEGKERRMRAKELTKRAKNAMQEGGSSQLSMTDMIRFVLEDSNKIKDENGH